MKKNTSSQPALLSSKTGNKQWSIEITLSGGSHCSIIWSDFDLARQEFQKIRSQGSYATRWIDTILFQEL